MLKLILLSVNFFYAHYYKGFVCYVFSALVAVSALMLAACSQSGNSQPSASSSQTSTQKTTAAGSACRSMGEGHKVNGKGQNDIYMCKVDVA